VRIVRKVLRAAGPALRRSRKEIRETTVDLRFVGSESEVRRDAVSCEVKGGSFVASGGVIDSFALPREISIHLFNWQGLFGKLELTLFNKPNSLLPFPQSDSNRQLVSPVTHPSRVSLSFLLCISSHCIASSFCQIGHPIRDRWDSVRVGGK